MDCSRLESYVKNYEKCCMGLTPPPPLDFLIVCEVCVGTGYTDFYTLRLVILS